MDAQAGFWGYHLMVDCGGLQLSEEKLNDQEHLLAFVENVLVVSDMKPWGVPIVMRLTEKDGEFPDSLSGWTIIQLLHTSNMTLHVCDKAKTLFFDLFSCKQFSNDKVIEIVEQYFDPARTRVNFLTRDP